MTDERDLSRPTFPHLDSLERVLVRDPDYLRREVTVTEKIHGFNARIGRDIAGKLWVGTRNEAYDIDDAPGLQGFTEVAWVFHDLPNGVTVYGEWAGKGIQKGIDYGEKRFRVFAERIAGGPVLSSARVLDQHALLGADVVPILYEGVANLDMLDEWRNGRSEAAPGDQPLEGVVIAPLEPVFDKYGHQVVAKFKAAAFQERVSEPRPHVDRSAVDAVAAEFVVPERLRHVLDQVAERLAAEHNGTLHETSEVDPLDVRQTGAVLKAMYLDVIGDAVEEYEALSEGDRKLLGSAINRVAKPLLDTARLDAAREAVEA